MLSKKCVVFTLSHLCFVELFRVPVRGCFDVNESAKWIDVFCFAFFGEGLAGFSVVWNDYWVLYRSYMFPRRFWDIYMRSGFVDKVVEMAFRHVSSFSSNLLYRVATSALLPSAEVFTLALQEFTAHLQYCPTLLHILQHTSLTLSVPRDPFEFPPSHDRQILLRVLWDVFRWICFTICGSFCAQILSTVVHWCNCSYVYHSWFPWS